MLHLKNFKEYTPEDSDQTLPNVIHLIDENKNDWYKSLRFFRENTYKVMYDPQTGKLLTFTKEASRLNPNTFSVIELNELPGLTTNDPVDFQKGGYFILDGKLTYVEKENAEYAFEARRNRAALLKRFDSIVSNPLRWEGLSTEKKEALKEYRQALLDISKQEGFPKTIAWPQEPSV